MPTVPQTSYEQPGNKHLVSFELIGIIIVLLLLGYCWYGSVIIDRFGRSRNQRRSEENLPGVEYPLYQSEELVLATVSRCVFILVQRTRVRYHPLKSFWSNLGMNCIARLSHPSLSFCIYSQVLNGMTLYKEVRREKQRFEHLVDLLKQGISESGSNDNNNNDTGNQPDVDLLVRKCCPLNFCTSSCWYLVFLSFFSQVTAISFVNALINCTRYIDDRVPLRNEFVACGIKDALKVIPRLPDCHFPFSWACC